MEFSRDFDVGGVALAITFAMMAEAAWPIHIPKPQRKVERSGIKPKADRSMRRRYRSPPFSLTVKPA